MPPGPDVDGDVRAPEGLHVVLEGAPDADAEFTAFVTASAAELGRVAWYLTGDADRAEDLLQTTLLRTYLHWSRASRVEAGPMAYARRVMANARTDAWRALRREHLVAPADVPDVALASTADASAERDRLARALATLTPRQRRIVVLRHLVGLPEAEVAAELGVSVGTVKSVSSRGLAHLRALLADDGDRPAVPAVPAASAAPGSRTPDADALVALGRRRRRQRRVAAGVLAAVLVAGAAGAAAAMLRPPVTPPADGDVAPAPAQVVGTREGVPVGMPAEVAGPFGVLRAPDGTLHVWTSGSSSCPTLPRTVGVTDGVVVVEVGTDPADGPECTADLVTATTVVALPTGVPVSPPPPVEVRDDAGAVLATSSDVPEGLEPVTLLEVRPGWPAGVEPEAGIPVAGLGVGTVVGSAEVWTAGTTDCPAVPVATEVFPEGYVVYTTGFAADGPDRASADPAACTGDLVLTTWVFDVPEPHQPGGASGAGPLSSWVPGAGWLGDVGTPPVTPPAPCPDDDAACVLDAWLVLLLGRASEPAVVTGQDRDPSAARVAEAGRSGGEPTLVGIAVAPVDGPELDDEMQVTGRFATDVVTVEEGLTTDGTQARARFTCGGFRFVLRGDDATDETLGATWHLAEHVAGQLVSCPPDLAGLATWVADRTPPVG